VVSVENVEWVRSAYGEPDQLRAFGARAAPDVEFDLSAVYPDQSVLRGIDEVRLFLGLTWGASQRFELERCFDVDGERVLAFVRGTATGPGSGATVEVRPAHLLTIRGGLLVRFEVYLDRAEALAVAGLRE
jgi:ketosteroid isomerase-like protein